jgi:cephalosporin-C deacetylase
MQHDFSFDPTYGFDKDGLLAIDAPTPSDDFADFWRATAEENADLALDLDVRSLPSEKIDRELFEVRFNVLGGLRVGAWLCLPRDGALRGIVVGHGYGGRTAPECAIPIDDAAAIFPCAPGFNLSAALDLPDRAAEHVVHGIATRETYILRACVAALWSSASVLQHMIPGIESIYLKGGSFGGGLGALALPWDERFVRAHLSVPTFGHHPLRLQCPCTGSGESVRRYCQSHPEVIDVLRYYDAAVAAQFAAQPVLVSPALFDPAVPPPGQFAVYNAWRAEKHLHVLSAGHFTYAEQAAEQDALWRALQQFFSD